MKQRILFIALFVSACSWGQIAAWDFYGTGSTSTPSLAATTYNASLDVSNLITRGATAGWSTSANNFRTVGFKNEGIATTNTDYFQVTLSASSGNTLSLSTIDARFAGTGTFAASPGVSNQFAYSLDGSSFTLISTPQILIGTPATLTQISLTGIPALQNVADTVTITIRFYASGQTTTGGWGFASGTSAGTNGLAIGGTIDSGTACSTPTSQASTISSSNVTTTTADLSWTAGATAAGTLVSLRQTSNAITAPSSSTNYTSTLAYSTASGANLIDANNVVVYKNTATTVTGITGLTAGTQYTATPYAYNGSGTNVCFNTTNPESFDFYTLALEPTTPTGSFSSCTAASTTSISLGFTAANTITNASGYILMYRQGAAPTGLPTDGAIYAGGTVIGDATVFNYIAPAATTATVTGLNGGSTYYFALIPYGTVAGPIASTVNYRTATVISTNCNTSPAPEITVKGVISANPTITDGDITPSSLDNTLFATVVVGGNQAKDFRITNDGNATLTINSITMVGGNNTEFVATGASIATFPFTIAAGASIDFTVTFTPTAAGTRNTTLTIANTDSNEGTYDFLIQGTGTVSPVVEINVKGNGQSIPDNSIYPSGLNHTAFPVTLQGGSSVRTFTIENLGTTSLSLTGTPFIQITGAHASLFTVSNLGTTSIAGGTSTTFDVTFLPTSGGAKNATILIYNNDSDENPYNFNIRGTCQGTNNIYVSGNGYDVPKGSLTTSTTNLTNFGLIAVTSGVKQNTFVITNLSGSTRYLSNASVSGTDAAMFTVISQPNNGAVSNANTTSFTINFTPTSSGVKTATVTFNVYTNSGRTTADSIDGTFTFAISGEGIIYTACSNNAVQTIAIQDFEAVPATPTWTVTSMTSDGVATTSGTSTYNNGSGVVNGFIGARAFQFTGIGTSVTRTAVINLAAVDVSQYNNINFSMRVGAFRTGSTQGEDINEIVQVETSIDGGINWSVESVLRGYVNSRWNFTTGTGVFNAYYTGNNTGITIDTRNGNAELTTTGISTYNVKNLPQSTSLLIRITLNVDRNDEIWALDNIKIEGQTPQSTNWNGTNWTASFPTPSTKAIFDANTSYTTTAAVDHGSVEACELEIKSNATVNIDSNYYFEIQSNITNAGTLNIANNGSLVQVNDTATDTGNIIYQRTASGIRGFDYVYWSSPVVGQSLNSIYSSPTPGYMYYWDPVWNNINSPTSTGNWRAASGTMTPGKGYIVRGSSSYGMAASSIPGIFTGTANNGVIQLPIGRGGNQVASSTGSGNNETVTNFDDNWNLIHHNNRHEQKYKQLAQQWHSHQKRNYW